MKEIILACISGFAMGMVFAFFKLPVPAPPTLAGVMGIVGVFLGFVVAQKLGLGK